MTGRMCVVLSVLALVYLALGHRYAAVWRSDLTLWSHAARMAPQKARPAHNYAKALWVSGEVDQAHAMFAR